MKNIAKILISLTLIFAFALTFVACDTPNNDENNNGTAEPTGTVNIATLNGTTGFGMAKLMSDAKDSDSALKYNIEVQSDAAVINAALISGELDIATLPTNAAANLYAKTNGGIKILAVNTLGVLYVIANEENSNIKTLSDLEGKTVYCPAQNPAFIFEAICRESGVNVTIDTAYAQPADLRTAVASGLVDLAVLPEPMVTIAKSSNDKLVTSLDLTEEWERVYGENTLMQGCIVVRTRWAEEHPEELDEFLKAYKESVEYTVANPTDAAELIVSAGVFAGKAPVAARAIPNCNIVYIDGDDMARDLSVFFEKLYSVNPAAVGGTLPDSEIYLEK